MNSLQNALQTEREQETNRNQRMILQKKDKKEKEQTNKKATE